MTTRGWTCWKLATLVLVLVAGPDATGRAVAAARVQEPRPPEVAGVSQPAFEGEYAGRLMVKGATDKGPGSVPDAVDVGLEVTALGADKYKAVLYYGGLPRQRSSPVPDQDKVELDATYRDFTLVLTGKRSLRLQYIHGRFTALHDNNNYMGHLARVVQ